MNIPFESQLQSIEDIDTRNVKFDSLSDEDKRKEIAYDLLLLLMSDIVGGSRFTYWSENLYIITSKETTSKQYQQLLIQNLPKCTVCARGGMMLSQIRLGNKIEPTDDGRARGYVDIIRGFSIESFINMEDEYETNTFELPYRINTTAKLANIACNVIANGDFDTEDVTDYLIKWNIIISNT